MDLYINSAGIISGSGNNKAGAFTPELTTTETHMLYAHEPEYTEIPPMQLRRMSKAVRMGISAAKIAMNASGAPDAIFAGTAMGCLKDTETFLQKMIAQDEQMLTPTAFIQSTHNTVAGQIALLSECRGQNYTYVHRGHSFEQTLIGAQLYLEEHPGEKVLAGGIDELVKTGLDVLQAARIYRQQALVPSDILHTTGEGSLAGEGAAFLMLTSTPVTDRSLHIKDLSLFVTKDKDIAFQKTNEFLAQNKLTPDNIDLVMLGISGDERSDTFYKQLRENIFIDNSIAVFKHLSGEYGTAISFAIGALQQAVEQNNLPEAMILNYSPSQLKHIVVINNYMHYYSCWCLEAT
jgi:3-oxoacyl-[acyl-carrier-protein] synthase II